MPRPKNDRLVNRPPLFSEFKPTGAPGRMLPETVLSLDEFEAIRLADHSQFSHEEAAGEMNISRSTFSRLIEKARYKLAELLVAGKRLRIEGGNIHFKRNIIQCQDCGHMFNIDIEHPIEACPECNSRKLLNLAGSFGHGHCCRGRK